MCSVGDADAVVACETLLERAKDVKSLLKKLSKHQSRSAHCPWFVSLHTHSLCFFTLLYRVSLVYHVVNS